MDWGDAGGGAKGGSAITVQSYSDWLMQGSFEALSKGHRDLGAPAASLMRVRIEETAPVPPTPDLVIQTVVAGRWTGSSDWGAGRFSGDMRPGHISVAPDGVPLMNEGASRCEFLLLAMHGETVRAAVLEETGRKINDFGRLHSSVVRDTRIPTLMSWLWEETEQGGSHGRLFADHAFAMITLRLLELVGNAPQLASRVRPQLAPWRLRRVKEVIETRSSDRLDLPSLAAEVGLSPWYLARAFRAETGVSPHVWALDLRLRRAMAMLVDSSETIAQIAADCGFASQQHFTTAFRKARGTTPAVWRRENQR